MLIVADSAPKASRASSIVVNSTSRAGSFRLATIPLSLLHLQRQADELPMPQPGSFSRRAELQNRRVKSASLSLSCVTSTYRRPQLFSDVEQDV